ncbi:glycoside hydrolase family 2 protein [Dothidotthia symphoricarpi CBS 119687]|uniref:Glycoside hydrolase family 2 protein n=1 Tax=Dothidotthia symphoricarpi CBS 119687 TaxID=1392245 RepID=A0A6A6AED7_9PLEO|nr:glycoside hydrolase family 2 protein [Dothidotthia symphoricarpi CBS 119687]KAF2129358.1 glycoside hydrolase family 2 protein [Dothidotthia symphoricarpi CBS 119687]
MTSEDYPRPDFVRNKLSWQSLNGPWNFLFDDNDIGLSEGWHLDSLPEEVTVNATHTNSIMNAEAQSITAKITGGTQELFQGNQFSESEATTHKTRDIQVPYVFQSPASGIGEKGVHEVLWYERGIEDSRTEEDKKAGHRVILRFGAVDYEAKIWVTGKFFGGHRGGHVPFDIDITDAFANGEKQRLTVRVYDSAYDLAQPRGKQYWGAKPESIFYTPSGGIWQSVWIETVPPVRIGDASKGTVLRSNEIKRGKLLASVKTLGRLAGHKYSVEIETSLGGVMVSKTERFDLPRDSDKVSFEADMQLSEEQLSQIPASLTENAPLKDDTCWLNGVALWSPEHPTLYDLAIRLYDSNSTLIDEVHTTTGMRSLSWNNDTFRLNDRPYFQALFLDQGYWPDTFMTPSSSALKTDIELSKKMGFNGCRKHQKVEDPLFHYWADRLGFLVWGEMANAYIFSAEYVERFDQEWREAVMRDINHPCVVAWTPVNESWGYTDLKGNQQQRDHIRSLYYATKTLDPTRPVNDNCGWEHVQTDLTTFHDYNDGDDLTKTCASKTGILAPKAERGMFLPALPGDDGSSHRDGTPIICTEFGGINIARSTVGKDGERHWGYTTATDPKDLLKRIEKMMTGIVDGGHIGGFVYTQLTDIEQEVNGLYTTERKEKLDTGEVRRIVEGVKAKYLQMHT